MRALALCLCLLGATASAASEREWRAWSREARGQHILAGRIYDVTAGKLSGRQGTVLPRLPDGLVLLGEVHDNPAHHRVRAWLIAKALRANPNRRPAVVFEQIRADQRPALDQFRARAQAGSTSATADELFRRLDWDKSGWPPAAIYEPIFAAAIAARLPIYPGDPARDRVRAVARGGAAALAPEERARLRLDDVLPAALAEALRQELVDSHCGALPPQAIPGMALAQRYRDAHLADALLRAAGRHRSAILVAGNGHVRSDRGVPWHVRRRQPSARLMSVLLLEVEAGKTEPSAYVPRDPEGKPVADLVIFTPRAEREDPCRRLRKR